MPSQRSPRLVLVHGSVVGGRPTWREQRRAITDEAELVVLERPGFPPGPVEEVDFEPHAGWVAERVRDGDHLVGHSYGGVIALLAAARVGGALRSLTVIEPPCTSVALDDPVVAEFARDGSELYASGSHLDPETFLRTFLQAVGSDFDPPSPLPPALEQGARALALERGPWEAEIPLEELRGSGSPRSSSRARTIPPSTRSATSSSATSGRSVWSSPATDTTPSSTRCSRRRCSTSSREPRVDAGAPGSRTRGARDERHRPFDGAERGWARPTRPRPRGRLDHVARVSSCSAGALAREGLLDDVATVTSRSAGALARGLPDDVATVTSRSAGALAREACWTTSPRSRPVARAPSPATACWTTSPRSRPVAWAPSPARACWTTSPRSRPVAWAPSPARACWTTSPRSRPVAWMSERLRPEGLRTIGPRRSLRRARVSGAIHSL